MKLYEAMILSRTTLTFVYTRRSVGSSIVFPVLYVDNILLISNDVKMLGETKAWLSTQSSMKDLCEASYILGIIIFRDRSKRMLGMIQNSYFEKVLKWFKMEHSKRGFLPTRHEVKLSKKQFPKTDEELKKILDAHYASIVGFAFMLNGGVVAWKSSKQDTTTDSTTEAEYIVASEVAKEAV
ncbi:hypothetical protein Sango_1596400 [Sesamum angolense]|uniref:Reverse transcriptase Ty1/copia-type domain-containing protein n=1 Tax=Sesamum angolense TaxID=2727404 RepID=A0AAE1WQ12_9LAMI|nr:hypothetical protein Sango_1596400 [Sesamum angolense]